MLTDETGYWKDWKGKLRCKKTYWEKSFGYNTGGSRWQDIETKRIRIKEGEWYEVLEKKVLKNNGSDVGKRYWCFLIPDKINPLGSGWFIVDDYFETPEELRQQKLEELLK